MQFTKTLPRFKGRLDFSVEDGYALEEPMVPGMLAGVCFKKYTQKNVETEEAEGPTCETALSD